MINFDHRLRERYNEFQKYKANNLKQLYNSLEKLILYIDNSINFITKKQSTYIILNQF